jgi:CBS domain containing-hemolysin-like protein
MPKPPRRSPAAFVPALAALLAAPAARASFLSGDALATAASYIAIFVIVVVPIVLVVLFWMVHVLPEKIAHKRRHPQTEAIQVLCLLSLVFGGLLWPFAWLWAYTKPVLYKMAYGTDKAHDPADEAGRPASPPDGLREDVRRLRSDLDRLATRPDAPAELQAIRDQLAALEPRLQARAEEAR